MSLPVVNTGKHFVYWLLKVLACQIVSSSNGLARNTLYLLCKMPLTLYSFAKHTLLLRQILPRHWLGLSTAIPYICCAAYTCCYMMLFKSHVTLPHVMVKSLGATAAATDRQPGLQATCTTCHSSQGHQPLQRCPPRLWDTTVLLLAASTAGSVHQHFVCTLLCLTLILLRESRRR